MKKVLRGLAGLVLGAVALVSGLFFAWPALDVAKNQVTVYPVMMTAQGTLVPLNRSVYKVFPETQTVIHWMPGISEVPDRLAKCSVRDRLHWRCEYPDGSAVLTMDGGVFSSESAQEDRERDISYTSRLKWWKLMF